MKTLLLFVFTPLFVWFLAFMAWFFWPDIQWLLNTGKGKTPAEQVRKPPKENIFEEDRKQLEDILKKRK